MKINYQDTCTRYTQLRENPPKTYILFIDPPVRYYLLHGILETPPSSPLRSLTTEKDAEQLRLVSTHLLFLSPSLSLLLTNSSRAFKWIFPVAYTSSRGCVCVCVCVYTLKREENEKKGYIGELQDDICPRTRVEREKSREEVYPSLSLIYASECALYSITRQTGFFLLAALFFPPFPISFSPSSSLIMASSSFLTSPRAFAPFARFFFLSTPRSLTLFVFSSFSLRARSCLLFLQLPGAAADL